MKRHKLFATPKTALTGGLQNQKAHQERFKLCTKNHILKMKNKWGLVKSKQTVKRKAESARVEAIEEEMQTQSNSRDPQLMVDRR